MITSKLDMENQQKGYFYNHVTQLQVIAFQFLKFPLCCWALHMVQYRQLHEMGKKKKKNPNSNNSNAPTPTPLMNLKGSGDSLLATGYMIAGPLSGRDIFQDLHHL